MFSIYSSDCPFLPLIPAIASLGAAGNRSNASGALENVGVNGRYWSSSSYAAGNVNAGNLNFESGNVNPLNNGNRAIGRSVRCVQHLQEAVFYPKTPHPATVPVAGCGNKKIPGLR